MVNWSDTGTTHLYNLIHLDSMKFISILMGHCGAHLMVKGTVHQMYECVSEVLLHLGRMFGIVFTAQTAQIWPKNEKTCF